MKIQKNKDSKEVIADKLGRAYASASAQLKDLGNSASIINEDIKRFAKEFGGAQGKKTIVYGAEYVVGFTTTDPSPVIDAKKLEQLVGKEVWTHITARILSDEKLESAVKRGIVSKKILSKCLVKSSKQSQERLYVALAKDHKDEA